MHRLVQTCTYRIADSARRVASAPSGPLRPSSTLVRFSLALSFAASLDSFPLRLVPEGNKDGSAYVQPATGGGARLPSVGRTNANDSSMQDGVGIRRGAARHATPCHATPRRALFRSDPFCPQAAFIFSMQCAACAPNAPQSYALHSTLHSTPLRTASYALLRFAPDYLSMTFASLWSLRFDETSLNSLPLSSHWLYHSPIS